MRPPIAWRFVLAAAFVKVAIHAYSTFVAAWGPMTDELYFLDSTDRLQWGYVDHPPLSIALLAGIVKLFGGSLGVLRLAAAAFGAGTVIVSGLIAREMGGRSAAQGLAALASLCCATYLAMGAYYSMNPIDQFVWPLAAWLLLRLVNGGDARLWLAVGVVLGLGLLNKISVLWLGAGIAVGLVGTPERRWFATPWPWVAAVIAMACLAPFVWWQSVNGWPFVEFSRNAAEYKIGSVPLSQFIAEQVPAIGVVAFAVAIAGLLYCLVARAGRPYGMMAWVFLVALALILGSGQPRPHYLAPAFAGLFAAGAVAVEAWTQRRRWIRAAVAVGVVANGAMALPLSLPMMSPQATVAYQNAIGFRPSDELESSGELFLHLGLLFHAEAVLRPVTEVYERLPPGERTRVRLLTTRFGETGAINVLGRRAGLPRSIGTHNQYWLWGPGDADGDFMIVVDDPAIDVIGGFRQCTPEAKIDCRYCMDLMRRKTIWLCRDARAPLVELWPGWKLYR